MFIKEKFMNRFDRTVLQLRGMGMVKYVPVLVCYILVPVTAYLLQRAGTDYDLIDTLWEQILIIYPVMAGWWIALSMEMVLCQEGEIFGLYERNKWMDTLIYYGLYIFMLLPVCAWMLNQWPEYTHLEEFLGLFMQCFLSCCLIYFVSCLVQSVAVSFVTILIFNLFLHGRVEYVLFDMEIKSELIFSPVTFLIAGVICLLIGKELQERGMRL